MFKFLRLESYKNRRVKIKFKEEIEPQEIFLDKLSKSKYEDGGVSEKKLEVPLSKRILQGIYLIFLILILVLFGKTFQLQIVQGEDFSKLSNANKFIVQQIEAQRGVIYDKDFIQLVFNKASFDLVCNKENLPKNGEKRKQVFREISAVIEKDIAVLDQEINQSHDSPVLISENLAYEELIVLEARKKEFSGFEIVNNIVRGYKDGEIFSHIIGYERKTGEKTGLEDSYNQFLEENLGKVDIERDAQGNIISEKIISQPEPGNSLKLWLDSQLQEKVKTELEAIIEEVGSKKGAAVVLDAETGGVLAMVSIPSFDNNLFSQGMSAEQWEEMSKNIDKPLFNRAVSATYPTGSTIKPLIAAAALEENIVTPEKKIFCEGKIIINSPWDEEVFWQFNDWKVHHWTNIRKAIAESCNIFFYTVGGGYKDIKGLGVDKMKKYLELFGWAQKTNIDLPEEKKGFIPDKEWKKRYFKNKIDQMWMPGDNYNLAIGQGYLEVTPLQVASAFVSIANRGTLYEPRVVKEIIDKNKNIKEEIEPKIIRQDFISQETIEVVRQGMRQAVTNGSATGWLDSLPVKAAAKTGTTETGRKDYYHNWVTVFAPYDDPKIVLTLVIEDVKGEMVAALPTARAILDWYFRPQE
ncbi:penicillin-binding protein 2 [Candidatus Parcubacteria bacterium]|nr:penicillin-binding protein 2 [Candidatus Parcubacteria bacterium]